MLAAANTALAAAKHENEVRQQRLIYQFQMYVFCRVRGHTLRSLHRNKKTRCGRRNDSMLGVFKNSFLWGWLSLGDDVRHNQWLRYRGGQTGRAKREGPESKRL